MIYVPVTSIPTGLPPNAPPLAVLRAEQAKVYLRMDYLDHRVKSLAPQYHTMSRVVQTLSDMIQSATLPTTVLQTLQIRETVLRQVLSEGEKEMFQIMREVQELRKMTQDNAARVKELEGSQTDGKAG